LAEVIDEQNTYAAVMHASRTTAERRSRTQIWKQGSIMHRCEQTKSTCDVAPAKKQLRISFNCTMPNIKHSRYVKPHSQCSKTQLQVSTMRGEGNTSPSILSGCTSTGKFPSVLNLCSLLHHRDRQEGRFSGFIRYSRRRQTSPPVRPPGKLDQTMGVV